MNPLGRLALPALLLAEIAAVRLLHAMGSIPGLEGPDPDPGRWVRWAQTTPPEDALAGVVRLLALGLAWWLLVSTMLAVVAAVSRWRPAQHAADVLAIRPVRAVVERAVAGMVVVSVASGPAAALAHAGGLPSLDGAPAVHVPAGPSSDRFFPPLPPLWAVGAPADPVAAPGALPVPPPPAAPVFPDVPVVPDAPAVPAVPAVRAGTADPGLPPQVAAATRAARTHVISAGEHLWWLAERTVRAADPAATDSRIAAYWRELVDTNRSRLRSGDPDVVHPGEEVILPPL